MTEQTLEVFKEQNIVAYDPFRAQLKELKAGNEKVVFDYEDEKGNKAARSHVYKLRQTKSAVDKVRKDQKQAALDYGRRVDGQAKEIISEIEEMIDVHQKPLDAIEQREKDRIAAHQASMDNLQRYHDHDFTGEPSETIQHHIDSLGQFEPDTSFEEFMAPATKLYHDAMDKAKNALEARLKYEAEQAELERLRAEKEERERQEREAKIAQEAAEKARIEAEQKAKADLERAQLEKEAAERKYREEQDARQAELEEAERNRVSYYQSMLQHIRDCGMGMIGGKPYAIGMVIYELENKVIIDDKWAEFKDEAIKLKKETLEKLHTELKEKNKAAAAEEEKRIQDEIKAKQLAEKEAARKREANQKHRAKINNAAADAIIQHTKVSSVETAKTIVAAIAKGEIPNVSISY